MHICIFIHAGGARKTQRLHTRGQSHRYSNVQESLTVPRKCCTFHPLHGKDIFTRNNSLHVVAQKEPATWFGFCQYSKERQEATTKNNAHAQKMAPPASSAGDSVSGCNDSFLTGKFVVSWKQHPVATLAVCLAFALLAL